MGSYRKRYPVYSPVHEDGDDDFDDFRPRRKKRGWIPWLSDSESEFLLRSLATLTGIAFTFFVFKLNERMAALELKFAIFEVRHEIASSGPSLIDDKSQFAMPELGIVPNFLKEIWGVKPLPMMNRKKNK